MGTAAIQDDATTVAATAAAQAEVDRLEAEKLAAPPEGEKPPEKPLEAVPDPAKPDEKVVAPPVVPEKYDLKLPSDSTLDPAIVERTAAIARELGLGNEAGQKVLDTLGGEITKAIAKHDADAVEANKPGGALWTARENTFREMALKDATIGGTPEKLAASTEMAKAGMTKFGTPAMVEFLKITALGSHPAVIAHFAHLGKASAEGSLVLGVPVSEKPKLAGGLYTNEGKGPLPGEVLTK